MSIAVVLITSSGVVSPATALRAPSSRSVRIPISRARARELGMRTLREDGTRKVLAGMTTADEVIRATAMDVD